VETYIRGDVQQPTLSICFALPHLGKQLGGLAPGGTTVGNRTSATAAAPPQCHGVALDEFKRPVQSGRFDRRPGCTART
jgi:hypothetical protein